MQGTILGSPNYRKLPNLASLMESFKGALDSNPLKEPLGTPSFQEGDP